MTAAVDHVFSILGATYGASWDRSLGSAPINDVKTIWCDALSDFTHSDDSKRAIMWALKNLPDDVPNASKFRTLCYTAPSRKHDALTAPVQKQNPEMAAKIREALSTPQHGDRLDWARRILQAVEDGARRTPTVVKMARDALAGV